MCKNRKLIAMIFSVLVIGTSLIGCQKDNGNDMRIVSETIQGDVATYTVYQPDDGIKKEDIEKDMNEIIKEKGTDKKGILVYFYEYENEAKYKDVDPYVVGSWGPSTGFNNAATQISSKNNNISVEFSTKKVKTTDDQQKIYLNFLSEIKDSKTNIPMALNAYVVEHKDDIQEKYGVDTNTFYTDIMNMYNRYSNDAITKIKDGK